MQHTIKAHIKEVTGIINNAGSTIPHHRSAFKAGFSFSTLTFEEQLAIWGHIWKHHDDYRMRIYAFFFLEQHMKNMARLRLIWETAVHWQEEANSWELCDSLSKIYTRALEIKPDVVYAQLKKWNKDANLWKRRQSLVSLLYYSRTKKIYLPFEKISALVLPLLTDKEYYVQKGAGWTLREMHNVYPRETMDLLEKNIKNISPIAFTIAIEKMTPSEKDALKQIRKK